MKLLMILSSIQSSVTIFEANILYVNILDKGLNNVKSVRMHHDCEFGMSTNQLLLC